MHPRALLTLKTHPDALRWNIRPLVSAHDPVLRPVHAAMNGDFVAQLQSLNRMLNEWGFRAPADFKSDVTNAFATLPADDPEAVAAFVSAQEDWVMQDDEILNKFDRVLAGELFTQLSVEAVADFWKEMSSVAFQVMYAISATEARLDMLPVS
ncbi:hypothetical protein LXA43DRAFT_1063713 [Ganoderma leucocontextum]|nr:hypothetical protein LXA43DRAFT_1063713 [Ganoderma leucocontextum]